MIEKIYQQLACFKSIEYKDFNSYPVDGDLLCLIRKYIPINWKTLRKGAWQMFSINNFMPDQGFKIHISATYNNRQKIIEIAIPILVKYKVDFKILTDDLSYTFINSKIQNPGSSGKYITIYPSTNELFKTLIEELYISLKNEIGPYILSDRRYKNCKCLYYRYGAFKPMTKKSEAGFDIYCLKNQEGELIEDGRHPYCTFPSWIDDPFMDEQWFKKFYASNDETDLFSNRYKLFSMIHSSNTGGIYKAIDTLSNKNVIIKEARPYTCSLNKEDSISRLRKERDFLINNQNNVAIPRYIDYFTEWEHEYLVMENIEGLPLNRFNNHNNPLFNNNSKYTKEEYSNLLISLWIKMAEIVNQIHKNNFIVGDISYFNFIIENKSNNLTVRIIDFETSNKINNKDNSEIATPGFIPYNGKKLNSIYSDIFALASTFIACIYPINNIYSLMNSQDRDKLRKYLISLIGMNNKINLLFSDILESKFEIIKNIDDLISFLKSISNNHQIKKQNILLLGNSKITNLYFKLLNNVKNRIDFWNDKSLIATDPNAFYSNTLCTSYGTAGIIHALSYIRENISSKLYGNILSKDLNNLQLGLYIGLSGIAWTLLENEIKFSENLFDYICHNYDNVEEINLYYGLSGIGLSLLYAYNKLKKKEYLDTTIAIYNKINKSIIYRNGSFFDKNGNKLLLGYYYGLSGIDYFFLELYKITNNISILNSIKSHLKHYEDGIVFFDNYSSVVATKENNNTICTPYLENGSAGVLRFLLKYFDLTKENSILSIVNLLSTDIMKVDITPFSGLNIGMAGLINTLLDLFIIFNDEKYIEKARTYITSIYKMIINIENNNYIAANQLFRISDDYISGSFGVLCTLYRYLSLINDKNSKCPNFDFMLN